MKLLFLHSISAGSGANVHINEFMEAATGLGAEVRCLGQATQSVRIGKQKVRTPVPQALKDLVYITSDLRYLARAEALLANWRPDAVYFRGAPYAAYGRKLALKHKLPLFYELNAPYPDEHLEFHGGHFGSHARRVEAVNRRTARRIFVVSRQLADILVSQGVDRERITVVPNAVTLERFDPTPRTDDGQVRFGFVGSLHIWHGIDILLQAFEEVLAAVPNAHLHIVGAGPQSAEVAAAARRSAHPDRLHVHGSMGHDQIPAFLHDMDVLLAPYPFLPRFYFSPLKLFEYLASGRAIAASAIGQIEEILADDVDGRLLPPGDVEALARCCIELAGDAGCRLRLGTAARRTANAHTWEQNARTILGHIADGIVSR